MTMVKKNLTVWCPRKYWRWSKHFLTSRWNRHQINFLLDIELRIFISHKYLDTIDLLAYFLSSRTTYKVNLKSQNSLIGLSIKNHHIIKFVW